MSQPSEQSNTESDRASPHNQLFDLGSLDSSALLDLSLTSLHQPRLSLQLSPTDLSISLPDVFDASPHSVPKQTPESSLDQSPDHPLNHSQKIGYDLSRHPSKRWTSFSELGRSVLRLKSFERSTIHGSSPYLRPRLIHMKPTSIYSTTSGSTHRHPFKLFHQEDPLTEDTQPEESANAARFTLPTLPPMSELLDGTTSLDKELSLIAEQSAIFGESVETSALATDAKRSSTSLTRGPSEVQSPTATQLVESQSQRTRSAVSSHSDPIISSTPPQPPSNLNSPTLTNQLDLPIESSSVSADRAECATPTAVLIIEESPMDSAGQDVVSRLPIIDELLKAGESKVDETDEDETAVTTKGPLLDILNHSNESKPNEDATSKIQPAATHHTIGGGGIFGRKKKISESSSFFKLLLIKGLGHFRPAHSSPVHNDNPKTLAPIATAANH